MHLKKEKCVFMVPSMEYLHHSIYKEGLQPTADKVTAITEVPQANNVSELKAFFGLTHYYGKFMQNICTVLALFYTLLIKAPVEMADSSRESFMEAKAFLKSPKTIGPL